jgi:hypothetical protein
MYLMIGTRKEIEFMWPFVKELDIDACWLPPRYCRWMKQFLRSETWSKIEIIACSQETYDRVHKKTRQKMPRAEYLILRTS